MSLADQPIPVHTDLTNLYGTFGTSLNHAERWNELAEEFKNRFGRPPAYIVRAPGRVNLIGEHIDYALFGVLPAAIERDILIACAPRQVSSSQDIHDSPRSVITENLDSKYGRQVFAPTVVPSANSDGKDEGWHLDINTQELRWESYVKAGYYGVLSHYFPKSTDIPVPADLLVTGSVPAGSGLSSSAAMVVASTLAFLVVNNKLGHQGLEHKPLSKGDLVAMTMENEKRVGVKSGGMDQAASVMSNPSSALYITFYPTLSASPTPLPPRALFIITNSLVISDKALTAKHRYNLRVVETLVGARILARALGIKLHDHSISHEHGEHAHGARAKYEKVTYREVLGRLVGEPQGCGVEGDMGPEALVVALKGVLKKLECLLPRRVREGGGVGAVEEREEEELGVTMDEMIEMSGLNPKVFHEVYLSWVDVEATHFQLYKRAKHVFSESLRVLQFRKICLDAVNTLQPNSRASGTYELEQLGKSMNASQKSCQNLFECSCTELDSLTQLCREAGAYGSRLTGAGWGGCAVSLVSEDQADTFIKRVKETYPPYKDLEGEKLNEVIFATRPSSGACVFKFE